MGVINFMQALVITESGLEAHFFRNETGMNLDQNGRVGNGILAERTLAQNLYYKLKESLF